MNNETHLFDNPTEEQIKQNDLVPIPDDLKAMIDALPPEARKDLFRRLRGKKTLDAVVDKPLTRAQLRTQLRKVARSGKIKW